jgi:hypothetical protein
VAVLDGRATFTLESRLGMGWWIMERRQLMTASAAILAWAPLRDLRAQTLAQATGQTAPPAAPATTTPATAGSTSTAAASDKLSNAQLDQLLAPIALYPDGLVAQLLMAATYPLEVVEAERWIQANPSLKGEAAVTAAKDKGWDPSVTSLVAFPQVLAMMNSKLDWTIKLGNAMMAQQSDVAGSIQRLRKQAQDAGNLKSTAQQTVTTQAVSAQAPAGTPPAIAIEPANPQTVYVPAYNPNYVYGSWPYADYPPTYFPPPAYYGVGPGWLGGLAFGVGIGVGFGFFGGWAWGGGWGGGWGWGGWGGGNSYTTINNNITHIDNHYHWDPNHNHWDHNPDHRHGVYGPGHNPHHPTPAQRQAFRGELDRQPRTSGLQGAGREPRTAERANENRANENRANENRREENRGNANRGEQHYGYENRGHAYSGVNHWHQVNHEAARGRSYSRPSHYNYHRTAYHGGGGHGGGRRR